MRLFIALNLPSGERDLIARATDRLRHGNLPVRWVEASAYHLTLKFLGEVTPAGVVGLEQAIAEIAPRHQRLSLHLRGAGAFPDRRRPYVWWVGIEPNRPLRDLQIDVERQMATLGYRPEQRPFSPHLTLGRTRREAPTSALAGAAALLHTVALDRTITIESLDLMRSHLSPRGAHYNRIHSAAFTS